MTWYLDAEMARERCRARNDFDLDIEPEPVDDEEREFHCRECLGIDEHHPNCPNNDDAPDDDEAGDGNE